MSNRTPNYTQTQIRFEALSKQQIRRVKNLLLDSNTPVEAVGASTFYWVSDIAIKINPDCVIVSGDYRQPPTLRPPTYRETANHYIQSLLY